MSCLCLGGRPVSTIALEQDFVPEVGPPAQRRCEVQARRGGRQVGSGWAGGHGKWAGVGAAGIQGAGDALSSVPGAAGPLRLEWWRLGMHQHQQAGRHAVAPHPATDSKPNNCQRGLCLDNNPPHSRLLHRIFPLLQREGRHAAGRHSRHSRAVSLVLNTTALSLQPEQSAHKGQDHTCKRSATGAEDM